VALNQRLDLLRGRLGGDEAANAEAARFQETLRTAIAEVRRLSNNLRPHVLEDLGLSAALRAMPPCAPSPTTWSSRWRTPRRTARWSVGSAPCPRRWS